MKQKIETLLNQLNHGLIERQETLKAALLTVLAGENMVLIGPPGTAKSEIACRIADSISHGKDDNGYFEYLLTKFSTPEEIFGPLSIAELKADRFKRNTEGYLPTVNIAFLDEIFKASSSILNALLTILNERKYHNGSKREDVPLRALIAASNELPTDQGELSALYDRFLVRSFVDYVSESNLHRLFEQSGPMPALDKLSAADLDKIMHDAESVTLPPIIVEAVQRIWLQHKETFKEDRRETLSDRRLKKVIKLLRVSAATNGRKEADLSDVVMLKDCLWNDQENAVKVRNLVLTILQSFSRPVPHNEDAAISTPASSDPFQRSRLGAVVNGLKGSGTEDDPLLIQSLEELMDLSRAEVGLRGYYFRQTTDIDCSALSSWKEINFKGHYDGGRNIIQYNPKPNQIGKTSGTSLFDKVNAQSSIRNIMLDDLSLTHSADGCQIDHCLSSTDLIRYEANNCIITACLADKRLIVSKATDCTITACQSGANLVGGAAISSTITDCLAVLNMACNTALGSGGIAFTIAQGSVVERCFVMGTLRNPSAKFSAFGSYDFSGIAGSCTNAIIRNCALGRLELTDSGHLQNRITSNVGKTSTLENNASIASNHGVDNINGKDGKTVAAVLFTQRYLEHTLGWDFDTVWQWDHANDRPALRSIGGAAISEQVNPAEQGANMTDLLVKQIRANIWL